MGILKSILYILLGGVLIFLAVNVTIDSAFDSFMLYFACICGVLTSFTGVMMLIESIKKRKSKWKSYSEMAETTRRIPQNARKRKPIREIILFLITVDAVTFGFMIYNDTITLQGCIRVILISVVTGVLYYLYQKRRH